MHKAYTWCPVPDATTRSNLCTIVLVVQSLRQWGGAAHTLWSKVPSSRRVGRCWGTKSSGPTKSCTEFKHGVQYRCNHQVKVMCCCSGGSVFTAVGGLCVAQPTHCGPRSQPVAVLAAAGEQRGLSLPNHAQSLSMVSSP